jgi:hypothetical protein
MNLLQVASHHANVNARRIDVEARLDQLQHGLLAFLRSPLCGAEPLVCPWWYGIYFGLVRRALCIFAPRSTPNELGLIAVTLFSEGRVAVWPLAVAAGAPACNSPLSRLACCAPSIPWPHLPTFTLI